MKAIELYDLVLDTPNEIFSPNTLKARIALNIKGLSYETKWLDFFQVHSVIPTITKTGEKPTVPVIVDHQHDDKAVQDSWEIVKYLDKTYPDTPPLIHGNNEALQFFFYNYANANILVPIFKLCVLTVVEKCPTKEMQNWFRQTREQSFNMTLEEFAGDDENVHVENIKSGLGLVHTTLKSYSYLSGEKPGFSDVTLAALYKMFSVFRSDLFEQTLLDAYPDDVLRQWWRRMEKYTKHSPPAEAVH
ncbi:uncharacterized protein BX664DRAFT_336117 [Halteromyces radiatus]|uniref:uncharacterized protein n=1 Tax=Halteromyces radiatus TaxID=101107 RepID=UPI00221E9D6E|nr:uncharacterized protein BX664DRAFT_336117 [Halteromyces radiatus]KAI8086544.1 hypothetical protein BX664DRAFT_336117 [Halteromyces radiatus]